MTGRRLILGLLLSLAATSAAAQSYRARIDTRILMASYRGLLEDSVPAASVVVGADGGLLSPDGYAVTCEIGATQCRYFRPGPSRTGMPWSGAVEVTSWGFGIPGLSARMQARATSDLRGEADGSWPGTDPSLQLLEAYAELARTWITARLGRQTELGRLGFQGFDGGRAALRRSESGFEAALYGGWGLARATAIPVTSPALNPLDDFQPRDRQLLYGASAGWSTGAADVRAEYRRAVDPEPGFDVEERGALSATFRPHPRVRFSGGAEYDFAHGWWGTSDVSLTYFDSRVTATAELRRYRPFFDLWTLWGAFSPVPHRTAGGAVSVATSRWLSFDGRIEHYRFDDPEADVPLAVTENDGWRGRVGARARLGAAWSFDAGYRYDKGVGASERHVEAGASWRSDDRISVRAELAAVVRPLELRFSESKARWHSLAGDLALNPRWRLSADVAWVDESRRRPDAAGFSWDQFRASTRLSFLIGSNGDRLPPGRRRPRPDPTAP